MGKHSILSPSGAHRWMNCTPSARLEQEFEGTESEAAKEGTAAHALCEHKLKKALRNGFTLAELLGVIVILSIIGLIAVRVIDSNLKESRYDTCMVQKNNLIDAAKMVTLDYPELLPDALESQTISVQVLKDGGEIAGVLIKGGYIEDDFVNPMTDENYVDSEGGVDVIVTSTNGRDYKYEVSFGNPDEDCHK